MPMPVYAGTPAGVPYGNLRFADSAARYLDSLTISAYGTASDITVSTGSHSGPVRWHIYLAANTTMHFPFGRPIPVEMGLYIKASKGIVLGYVTR